jgi:hypothetical protein
MLTWGALGAEAPFLRSLSTIPAVVSVTSMIPATMKVIVSIAIVVTVPVATLPVIIRVVICRRISRGDDGNTRAAHC